MSVLAEPFLESMSQPAVTKHLKVLENAGLITKGREGQWRPCRLNIEGLKPAADWMDQYRKYWEESLDRLGDYLKTVMEEEQKAAKAAKKITQKKGKSRGHQSKAK